MILTEIIDTLYFEIRRKKVPFFVVFSIIVFLTYAFLYCIDFIPEPVSPSGAKQEEKIEKPKEETKPIAEAVVPVVPKAISAEPIKVIFDSLNKEVKVLNPTSHSVADLDTALLSGAVHHPDSANFAEKGNIFILGHSSYLPKVINKNFQAFNGIQKLVWGDLVRLQSEDTEYVYRVQKVYEAKASDVFVPETPGKAMLTLATCNSFGTKDDRFVVEALLIDSKPL